MWATVRNVSQSIQRAFQPLNRHNDNDNENDKQLTGIERQKFDLRQQQAKLIQQRKVQAAAEHLELRDLRLQVHYNVPQSSPLLSLVIANERTQNFVCLPLPLLCSCQ